MHEHWGNIKNIILGKHWGNMKCNIQNLTEDLGNMNVEIVTNKY